MFSKRTAFRSTTSSIRNTIPSPYDYAPRAFLINGALYHASLKADAKKGVLVVTADDLPPLYAEPLSPPLLDRALAIAGSYQTVHAVFMAHQTTSSVRTDPKDGPQAKFCCAYGDDRN